MKIYVKEYGAVADGSTNDTKAIQKAIDYCSENGGEVIIQNGVYLCGTILLKSNVAIVFEEKAVMLGSSYFEDYDINEGSFIDAVGNKRGRSLILANNAKNISIKGKGKICGRGALWSAKTNPHYLERPFLVRIVGCENVLIEDVLLKDAAAWCLHLLDSKDVSVKNIQIINKVNTNNDAIDIDACRNVKITGCNIDSSDDALCLKATMNKPCENIEIDNCVVSTNWAGLKIGTESVGDFKNISLRNCYFYDVNGCAIKIVPVDGGCVENVLVDNVEMVNCTGPIFISLGERLRRYIGEGRLKPGYIKNVEIKNIKADVVTVDKSTINDNVNDKDNKEKVANGCIVISGLKNQDIENVNIHDCEFNMPGGISEKMENVEVKEMGTRYPEFYNFGILPAYGFYIRHAKNIKLENNKIKLKEKDARKLIVEE